MSHYRSIDTSWEEDEIIYFDILGSAIFFVEVKYLLLLNGRKKTLLTRTDICHEDLILEYFKSISFTGVIFVSYPDTDYFAYEYRCRNGLLHNEYGPAKTWFPREISDYTYCYFYKRGKPWCCLTYNGDRYNSSPLNNKCYLFNGELWKNTVQ